MKKEVLIARAQELQIEVPEGATNKELVTLIKLAEYHLLTEELQETKAALADANEKITSLEQQLATGPKEIKKTTGAQYKSDTGDFEFSVDSFRFKGQKYEAALAVENAELMEALIEAKFNHLKKL